MSAAETGVQSEKAASQGPQFASGVIVKITDSKPLPDRKRIKVTAQTCGGRSSSRRGTSPAPACMCVSQEALSRVSPVAYVDVLEGDAEGHVRFHRPEDARAVSGARAALQKELGWRLEVITGEREQRYWQKILVDRQVKLNRPREKKRGADKVRRRSTRPRRRRPSDPRLVPAARLQSRENPPGTGEGGKQAHPLPGRLSLAAGSTFFRVFELLFGCK